MNLKSRIHEATAFTDLLCQTSAQVAGAYEWADTKKFVVRHFREAWAEETVEGWDEGREIQSFLLRPKTMRVQMSLRSKASKTSTQNLSKC